MSFDYLATIKPFAQQVFNNTVPQRQWKFDSFKFLRSLLRLLDNPNAIFQSCFGLCGQVAFLRSWAYRDPVAVAQFAIDLYMNGSGKIGDFTVSPDNDMLWCTWLVQPPVPSPTDFALFAWGPGNPISECVWMICGGLANITKTSIAVIAGLFVPGQPDKFNGFPASNVWTLALPENIRGWLIKTGCYASVVDTMDVTDKVLGNNHKTLANDSILTSNFTEADDIILCINTNLLSNAISISPSRSVDPSQFGGFPDHYVMLNSPITQTGNVLTLNIWTWGGNYTVKVSVDVFNSNYYGSITAHALTPRRTLSLAPLKTNALQNQRVYFTKDKILHFDWDGLDPRTEWYELHRLGAGLIPNPAGMGLMAMREILQRVWPNPTPGGYQVTTDSTLWHDPSDTLYDIVACHATLKPYDCDPFSYNHYNDVQLNVKKSYRYGGPFCEAQTAHYSFKYDQVEYKYSTPDTATIQFGGEDIGCCYADGRLEIIKNNTHVLVGSKTGMPLIVQKIAVWMEYFYDLFSQGSYTLQCAHSARLIEVTIGRGTSAQITPGGTPKIGIDVPAADQDLPGVCLKRLLALEFAQTNNYPEWIFPAFVSRASIVQLPAPVTPDGYADFHVSVKPCEWIKVYDAQWRQVSSYRRLSPDINKPLNTKMAAAVFIQFDKTMLDNSIQLTVVGFPKGFKTIGIPVSMLPSQDHLYYYGFFQPANPRDIAYSQKLLIQATRSWSNPVLRALLGDGMDANPESIPQVDTTNIQTLSFEGVDAGSDRNHEFNIGTQASYAPIAILIPDDKENNNSFSAATKISLYLPEAAHKIGETKTAQIGYDNLNFHDQQDIDYFDVSFQGPVYDDTDEANRPRTSGNNSYSGLSYGHQPPVLSCRVTSGDCHCIDIAVYKYDAVNPAFLTSEAKTTLLPIDSPSRNFNPKRCYFVIQNHDFTSAGAFPYTIQISYSSASDQLELDTSAPLYTQGKTSIKRKLLDKLYRAIDKPRPPEYEAEIVRVDDAASFIAGYEQFLLDREVVTLVTKASSKAGRAVIAEGLRSLGQVAQAFMRYDDSERIYRESASMFTALGDKTKTVGALESLEGLYKTTGNTLALRSVRLEIRNLRLIIR
jgi:hypothetical protein